MITIKVRRENGKEHTFNVHKFVVTPPGRLIVTSHFGIDGYIKFATEINEDEWENKIKDS